jgi:hypothetical protein
MENSNDPLAQALIGEMLQEAPLGKRKNTQLFENNTLAQNAEANGYYESGTKLFGDRPPNLAIKTERPEHRIIVYLKARGLNNQEIADRTGYGYQWICQIVRQPWFRQRFVEECQAAGLDQVKQFLEGEVIPSLEVLRDIRDNDEAKDASRVVAANSLLDRFLGKPVARVETESVSSGLDDARATVDELEKQVANLRAQNGLAENNPPQS